MIPSNAIILHRKSGSEIVILNLKEYTLNEIDESCFDETKTDYQITCPYCVDAYLHDNSYTSPYLKYKLYVKKDFSIGHCFRCDRVFVDNDDSLKFEISYPEPRSSMETFELVKLNHEIWNLDMFESFSEFDQIGYNYLVYDRHMYLKELYRVLKIRFSDSNPVIPFFFKGELIYYQIKIIHGNIPYFSPPITHKPGYIIEHGDNKKFVICEGVFDAIACLILYPDRTPFAVLGSNITDYQIAMLRSYIPEDILVYMDETELSKKVMNRIYEYINYAELSIRPSNGTDPEEYLKYKLSLESELL